MSRFLTGITLTKELINDIIFMCKYRSKSTYFTRNGKMEYQDIILFILNFVKKSLQIELDSYFNNVKGIEMSITKQSFSEARQKILPEAFAKMFYQIVEWFYGEEFKTYKGYRLSAIDGSVIELNNSETLRKAYGFEKNDHRETARALASGIYDLENDLMITAKIVRCKYGERKLAKELIEELIRIGVKKDLLLFDRGYPATELIKQLEDAGIKYLMRVSSCFLKAINKANEPDQVVEIRDGKNGLIKVRVVTFMLDSGITEKLITNLFDDEEFSITDLKELYFKRWGIETKYNELKNRLQLENFTGDTSIAIEQDFYASMYLLNMAALAKADANDFIQERQKDKILKYEYKVNANILIGKLKDNLVLILLEENPWKRSRMLNKLMKEISRNIIPIRPDRSHIRRKGLKSNKYPLNQKKCL